MEYDGLVRRKVLFVSLHRSTRRSLDARGGIIERIGMNEYRSLSIPAATDGALYGVLLTGATDDRPLSLNRSGVTTAPYVSTLGTPTLTTPTRTA